MLNKVAVTLSLVLVLGVAPAEAQRTNPSEVRDGQSNGDRARRGPMKRGGRGMRDGKMAQRIRHIRSKILRERLGLSEDRAQKVEAILDSLDGDRRKAQKRLRRAKRQLRQLVEGNDQDDKVYDAAIDELMGSHQALDAFRRRLVESLKTELNGRERAQLLLAMQRMQRKMKRRMMEGRRGKMGRGGRQGPPPEGRRGRHRRSQTDEGER